MIPKPLDQIGEADLTALIGTTERKSLEFKRELPRAWNDEATREFLADVSSLANATGGDLVYGVEETAGAATKIVGIDATDLDKVQAQLAQKLLSGIDPRLPRWDPHVVTLADGRAVLILRVPQSWIGPHRVAFKDHGHFYARHANGKYRLDVGDLRTAFIGSESLAERVRSFRAERLMAIKANDGAVQLKEGGRMVLHLLALDAFSTWTSVPTLTDRQAMHQIVPLGGAGGSLAVNLDGFAYHSGDLPTHRYAQLFRNGAIEGVLVWSGDRKSIPSTAFENYLISAVRAWAPQLRAWGASGPVSVGLAFLNVKGWQFGVSPELFWPGDVNGTVRRDDLILPMTGADSLDLPADVILRPSIDLVWNAFGVSESVNFDPQGKWDPDHRKRRR